MTTLKEFEDALREQGMQMALAILQKLRERDKDKRSVAPARRITGRKMTPELARHILDLHATTDMTQQEIAFELGVNQGRVNEVIKRGKWLDDDPNSPEAIARDKAKARMKTTANRKPSVRRRDTSSQKRRPHTSSNQAQLSLGDL
ncbi:RNA polymerase subunit sigma-70 [Microvirga sp. ACRRW]|uniref:RNA polymerase subunit sigma-70 n=1 Tax=Microvirga sp. ACRRW TaxID=2918205 RepID=UPI001EF4F9A3|nr:RNA polymerase subunit sigma-70 [Microvirga sp. ACRRW]